MKKPIINPKQSTPSKTENTRAIRDQISNLVKEADTKRKFALSKVNTCSDNYYDDCKRNTASAIQHLNKGFELSKNKDDIKQLKAAIEEFQNAIKKYDAVLEMKF